MKKIVLASASPRRKEILEQVGISFDIIPSTSDEVITKDVPKDIVEELAEQKAYEVFSNLSNPSIVIGADTIVVLNNSIMGKPKDEIDAFIMLDNLQNKTHTVYTGVCIYINKNNEVKKLLFSEATNVTMYPMSKEQIYDYIATKEPMDKAGAYGIQGKSAIYIKKIDGDYNTVVGLPIARLYTEMLKLGINLKKI
ncbi:MAG TPA: septum formation inhibitor Maf [Clostridiales bacterium]|nr:septum formation inhibitor Maf [Clostridiales bacterium]